MQRQISQVIKSQRTSDGAGVTLRRSIGLPTLPELDPFLLLDNFGTENPDDYIAGFPDHPHRGFETVTYMIKGLMRHRDNTGTEGLLRPGGIQWMTAGRGIVHSEMPEQTEGEMSGFQLWVNLPASRKMCEPRYQDIDPEDVPSVTTSNGAHIKVLAGTVDGVTGPISKIDIEPTYIDIELPGGGSHEQPVPSGHTAFVYAFGGSVEIKGHILRKDELGILGEGDRVRIGTGDGGRCILVAGKPFNEPIERYGPFVMNTRQEIQQAIFDYQTGNF